MQIAILAKIIAIVQVKNTNVAQFEHWTLKIKKYCSISKTLRNNSAVIEHWNLYNTAAQVEIEFYEHCCKI